MSYTLLRTEKYEDQLNQQILYIAEDSGDVEIALKVLDTIEAAILHLRQFPESGSIPRYASLRRRGYRVLIAGKYLTFYKVDHAAQTVTLHALVSSDQHYLNLI